MTRYLSAWSAPSDLDYYQQNLDPPRDPEDEDTDPDPEGEDDPTGDWYDEPDEDNNDL